MEPNQSFSDVVVEKLINQLKAGTSPWQKQVLPGEPNSFLPMNPTTGKRYKGINAIHLMAQGHHDSRWMTHKQAADSDAQVRNGEKGTQIQYWSYNRKQDKLDDNGKPILDEKGHVVKENVRLERPRVCIATVFNGEQIDGLPPLQQTQKVQDNNRAETILKTSGATFYHGENNHASYQAETDTIHLPPKEQFPSDTDYYATALRELGHWTGHPSRLNRDLSHPFGSEGHAKEELRTEMASMILGDTLGIGHTPKQDTAFVNSWIKALQDNPLEILHAASDAERIHDSILAFEQKQVQQQDQSHETSVQPSKVHTGAQEPQLHERQYITVPYQENEEAKDLGARWDRQQKSWYVPPEADEAPFAQWVQGAAQGIEAQVTQQSQAQTERVYLTVPYGEHTAAKDGGALWDQAAKSWYMGPQADREKLEQWKPHTMATQQRPAMAPREEFTEALRVLGCHVTDEHPLIDGKTHRIKVEGDKKGETSGFYVGHLNGHPAGYMKNNRTGLEIKWKAKGYSLNAREKAKFQAEAVIKLADREAERNLLQKAAALRVCEQMNNLQPIDKPTPYLQVKGIQATSGVLTDKDGQTTFIPAFDVEGKQWTTQTIQEDGTKRFAKDSRKAGCFHPIDGMKAVASAQVLVIAEGYSTAATLAEALGQPTVAAFDTSNLLPVARALHEKFPEKPIIIAGDDDQHLGKTQGINPGRLKAEEAAKAVGGKAIFPIFASGEQMANPKGFTDFNDLATKSALGKEAVKRQVGAAVSKVISDESQRKNVQQLKQKQEQKQQQRPRRVAKI